MFRPSWKLLRWLGKGLNQYLPHPYQFTVNFRPSVQLQSFDLSKLLTTFLTRRQRNKNVVTKFWRDVTVPRMFMRRATLRCHSRLTQDEDPSQVCTSFYTVMKMHVWRQLNGLVVKGIPTNNDYSIFHAHNVCSQLAWNMTVMETRGQWMEKKSGQIWRTHWSDWHPQQRSVELT
jgi:hypothetical protein